MKSNIHEKSVSPAMLTYVAACIACFTSCKMCSTHSRETTNQWQSDISSQFYLDAMRFYFPSNLNEIARGRSFLQAMEGDRVTDIGEFLNRDVCLFVHTIRNNPGFVVYPISDLLDGNHWGVLGEHTNIQINVMSTNDSDLRPMTARGWGAALLGTIVSYSEKNLQVSLLVDPEHCHITNQ